MSSLDSLRQIWASCGFAVATPAAAEFCISGYSFHLLLAPVFEEDCKAEYFARSLPRESDDDVASPCSARQARLASG